MGKMIISVIISRSTLGDRSDKELSCYLSAIRSFVEREYPESGVSVWLSSNDQPNIVSIRGCPAHLVGDEVYQRVTEIIADLWEKTDLWDPSMK